MSDQAVMFRAYNVAIDPGSLESCDMAQAGRGYSLRLTGPVDSHWRESYRLLRQELPRFSRFVLLKGSIVFAARVGDKPADLEPVLALLEDFIELTNRHASTADALRGPDPSWLQAPDGECC